MSISHYLSIHISNIVQEVSKKEENHSCYEIAKDFILPIVIALLAAWAAYYIFIKETNRDKQKELKNRLLIQNDKLTYFTTLVKSILNVSEKQKNYLKEYIREISADDVNFHLINYVPIVDLKRIVENTDLEAYMLAYSNHFSSDRTAAIKEYQKIIADVDFLFNAFNGMMEQVRNAQSNDHSRKMEYREFFYSGNDKLGTIEVKLKTNKRWHDSFLNIRNNYLNQYNSDYDLNFFQSLYFVPFYKFSADYNSSTMPTIEELINLELTTYKGKHLFKHIKAENQRLRTDLIKEFKKIAQSIIDLKKITKVLLADF